jgi:hypothetical protein
MRINVSEEPAISLFKVQDGTDVRKVWRTKARNGAVEDNGWKKGRVFRDKGRATPVMERGGEILGEQDVRQSTRASVKGKRKIEFSVEGCLEA